MFSMSCEPIERFARSFVLVIRIVSHKSRFHSTFVIGAAMVLPKRFSLNNGSLIKDNKLVDASILPTWPQH